jgi:hypothetical protein
VSPLPSVLGHYIYHNQFHLLFGPPTAPFVFTVNNFRQVQKSQLQALRSTSYKGSETEWEAILARTLLHKPIPKNYAAAFETLEFIANVASDASTLELIWRHKARTKTVRDCLLRLFCSSTDIAGCSIRSAL